jgi:hypothetical protein
MAEERSQSQLQSQFVQVRVEIHGLSATFWEQVTPSCTPPTLATKAHTHLLAIASPLVSSVSLRLTSASDTNGVNIPRHMPVNALVHNGGTVRISMAAEEDRFNRKRKHDDIKRPASLSHPADNLADTWASAEYPGKALNGNKEKRLERQRERFPAAQKKNEVNNEENATALIRNAEEARGTRLNEEEEEEAIIEREEKALAEEEQQCVADQERSLQLQQTHEAQEQDTAAEEEPEHQAVRSNERTPAAVDATAGEGNTDKDEEERDDDDDEEEEDTSDDNDSEDETPAQANVNNESEKPDATRAEGISGRTNDDGGNAKANGQPVAWQGDNAARSQDHVEPSSHQNEDALAASRKQASQQQPSKQGATPQQQKERLTEEDDDNNLDQEDESDESDDDVEEESSEGDDGEEDDASQPQEKEQSVYAHDDRSEKKAKEQSQSTIPLHEAVDDVRQKKQPGASSEHEQARKSNSSQTADVNQHQHQQENVTGKGAGQEADNVPTEPIEVYCGSKKGTLYPAKGFLAECVYVPNQQKYFRLNDFQHQQKVIKPRGWQYTLTCYDERNKRHKLSELYPGLARRVDS